MQKPYNSGVPGGGWATRLARNILAQLVVIALLGILIYSNTFGVPLQFDDNSYIENNLLISTPGAIFSPISTVSALPVGGNVKLLVLTRYMGHLSFAFNYWLGGLEPSGYHALNLLIHIMTALTLYWLVLLTLRAPALDGSKIRDFSRGIAFISALLFVCHPVQTAAVTYLSQRFASLCTLFYLLSLALYAGARLGQGKGRALYALSFLSALAAMFTKETSLTLPLAIALYEFMFFRAGLKNRAGRLAPFLLLLPVIPALAIATNALMNFRVSVSDFVAAAPQEGLDSHVITRGEYLLTQMRVMGTYLRLLVLPVNQNLDYDAPLHTTLFDPNVIAGLILVAAMLGLGIFAAKRAKGKGDPALRVVAFGIFFYFLALSVESTFIVIPDLIFEHRLYLPSAGMFMAVASGAFLLREKLGAAGRTVAPVFVIAVLVFAAAAHARNGVWKTEISLWEDTVRKSPGKTRPHNNLGLAYDAAGMSEQAAEQFARAVELSSGYEEAVTNLGVAYLSMGKADEAIAHYTDALGRDPESGSVHYNLGFAYQTKGQNGKALEHYERSIGLSSPQDAFVTLAYNNMGVIYLTRGDTEKAIAQFNKALARNPYDAQAHNNLGNAYSGMGLAEKAIEHYARAVQLKPGYAQAHYNLGSLYGKTGRLREARQHLLAAVGARPDYSEAHNSLGNVYFLGGDFENSARHFELAIEHSPDNYQAHYNLAVTYGRMGMEDKAAEHFRRAEDIKKRQVGGPTR